MEHTAYWHGQSGPAAIMKDTRTADGAPAPTASTGDRATDRTRWFEGVFDDHFAKLHRYLSRISNDDELASELAQEAFLRLYQRRSPPDDPEAWVFTVGINLLRNAKSKTSRRRRLLTLERSTHVLSDAPAPPSSTAESTDARVEVQAVLVRLSERDRELLLLRAEGYSYKELAKMLGLHEASVGTQLKRAKHAFRTAHQAREHG